MSVFAFIFSCFAIGFGGGVLLSLLVACMIGFNRQIGDIANV